MGQEHLEIRGAREHNLKGVDLKIPKLRLVVFTGVSGSGKSSLAFDTLFAEGQRRYVESLSAYARQFLGQMEKPHYDSIKGLSPTISIEQKAASKNPRSTVGTITEIHDYLRVLFARAGQQRCHQCGAVVEAQSAQEIVDTLEALPEGRRFLLLAPIVEHRKGAHKERLDELRALGFTRVRLNGEVRSLDEEIILDPKRRNALEVVVDRLVSQPGQRARLADSVEAALRLGEGALIVAVVDGDTLHLNEHRACAACQLSFPELIPASFSFNSPLGMCPECNGLGTLPEADPALIIPDPSLSVEKGAIKPWVAMHGHPSFGWLKKIMRVMAEAHGVDLRAPFSSLSPQAVSALLHGTGAQEYAISFNHNGRKETLKTRWEGALPHLLRRWRETDSEDIRDKLAPFFNQITCHACGGHRLRPESASVYLDAYTLPALNSMTILDAWATLRALRLEGNRAAIASELLKEIDHRLRFLCDVGLSYLNLARPGPTLSGGESQRIRLASQLGSELTGVLYILDEPSIGLHPRDNQRLIQTLTHLRDLGNSVIVVEHDAEMMLSADWIVDFGPGAGRHGGEIIASGPPSVIKRAQGSLTGDYLAGRRGVSTPTARRPPDPERMLIIHAATENNLKGIDARIPVGLFTCVTGVSGAGKSTLVNDILYPAAANALNGASLHPGAHESISGLAHFDKIINIDQKPIGRTPRSNPATYTKLWDDIRQVFAITKESKTYGFNAGRFSFNVKGGRCEACQGAGVRKVEMHFLADVYITCEVCKGARFNDATLRVRYRGKTISDLLETSVDDAIELFEHHKRIHRILKTLQDVGLGYLHLGQASTTLSGGEAQRIKLSRELAKRATGRTLYILDEPSTGLHFEDVRRLLEVIKRLVDAGNTVVMIEHNLDIIKTADWILDLGPEGGEAGGQLLAEGTPEALIDALGSHTGRFLQGALGSIV
ncbi:excinuclease ABC subunit UvrA [Myxococcota bacterium]|nr:excinuclease ABC subunit UvrA [Myxococcota bacterium]MBU1899743.1 excinuclease ABC subunit UvrA [Myxococcota bacterium]